MDPYTICKDIELAKKGDAVSLTLIGKWDWISALEEASQQRTAIFSHEASGFGPIGIQPHSGLVWNTDNEVVGLVKKGIGHPEASFYTSADLEENGREFLELYVGWHGRHPDPSDPASSFQRQRALIAINRYAKKLWEEFYREQGFSNAKNPLHFYLEGAWRLYDNPEHFANVLKSLHTLEQFSYEAEAYRDPKEIASRVPFYEGIILQDQMQGAFFPDDGLIDSNELRKFLWNYLVEKREGKPRIQFLLNSEVADLVVDSNLCQGVLLVNGESVPSDITLFAMGLENKKVLKLQGIDLPLWSVWGSAIRASLSDDSLETPHGGVSFHTQRCITGLPDGKTITIAGTSMVISEGEVPSPALYEGKLTESLLSIFKGRFDPSTIRFSVAPRTGIPDDLPIIGFNPGIENLILLNPTSHLGNTQAIALGKLASLYVLQMLGENTVYPEELRLEEYRLDRFQKDREEVQKERKKGNSLLF